MKILNNLTSKNLKWLVLNLAMLCIIVLVYFANRPIPNLRDYTYAFTIALIGVVVLDWATKIFVQNIKENIIEFNKILNYVFFSFFFLLLSLTLNFNYSFQVFYSAFFIVAISIALNLYNLRLQVLLLIFISLTVFITGNFGYFIILIGLILRDVTNNFNYIKSTFFKLYTNSKSRNSEQVNVNSKTSTKSNTKTTSIKKVSNQKKSKESRLNKPKHSKKK